MHCTTSIMGARTLTQCLQCRMGLWTLSCPFWVRLEFLLLSSQEMHSNVHLLADWTANIMIVNGVKQLDATEDHTVSFFFTTKYLQLQATKLFTHLFFSDLNCLTVSFTDTKPKSSLVSSFTSSIFYLRCMLCINSSCWLKTTNLTKDYKSVCYISRNQRFAPVKLKSGPSKDHLSLFALTMTHAGLSEMFKGKIM